VNDDDPLYTIGELARRTGLPVKTIRFYSDRGIVSAIDRNPAGHRRYDSTAAASLDLVRTLRDLGLDLATIGMVVHGKASLPEVAATHAAALTAQIRTLCVRHAVLTVVAERGSTPQEMSLVHKLAKLSEDERRDLIGKFLDSVFGGINGEFAGIMRTMTPELPDHPDAGQVEAWVELSELTQDPDFRAGARRIAEHHAAEFAGSGTTWLRRNTAAAIRAEAGPALAAGVDPATPEADAVVAAVVARYAAGLGRSDDVALRRGLLAWLETANDPRRERYFQLLALINGWAAPESLAPVFDWTIRAVRARTAEADARS
jgi:DNA-binding transcriptional MerR regulator